MKEKLVENRSFISNNQKGTQCIYWRVWKLLKPDPSFKVFEPTIDAEFLIRDGKHSIYFDCDQRQIKETVAKLTKLKKEIDKFLKALKND